MAPRTTKSVTGMARLSIYLHDPEEQLAGDIPWRANMDRFWQDETTAKTYPQWPLINLHKREIRLDCLDPAELPIWACAITVVHPDRKWVASLSYEDMAAFISMDTMYQYVAAHTRVCLPSEHR